MKNYIEETLLIISLTFMSLYMYGKICEAKGFIYLDPFLLLFPLVILVTLFFVYFKKNRK